MEQGQEAERVKRKGKGRRRRERQTKSKRRRRQRRNTREEKKGKVKGEDKQSTLKCRTRNKSSMKVAKRQKTIDPYTCTRAGGAEGGGGIEREHISAMGMESTSGLRNGLVGIRGEIELGCLRSQDALPVLCFVLLLSQGLIDFCPSAPGFPIGTILTRFCSNRSNRCSNRCSNRSNLCSNRSNR